MINRLSGQLPADGSPVALIADEGEEQTRWLAGLLQEAGYAVHREQSGERVIQRAREDQPDVIVIASDLADTTRIDLCRALRTDARLQHKPPIFVALTQPATTKHRLAALRAGASECIALPLDSEEVVLRAESYVHTKRDAERSRADGLLDQHTGLYNRQGLARRARELGSQAFREHGPLACVVLALDLTPDELGRVDELTGPVSRGVHALQAAARRSDVIGRLGPAEFAVLAPGTNAAGARCLAERLAVSLEASGPESELREKMHVRCGYEAVANVGYTPIEPVDLLVRAAATLRSA